MDSWKHIKDKYRNMHLLSVKQILQTEIMIITWGIVDQNSTIYVTFPNVVNELSCYMLDCFRNICLITLWVTQIAEIFYSQELLPGHSRLTTLFVFLLLFSLFLFLVTISTLNVWSSMASSKPYCCFQYHLSSLSPLFSSIRFEMHFSLWHLLSSIFSMWALYHLIYALLIVSLHIVHFMCTPQLISGMSSILSHPSFSE